jgi:ATP-dependent Clp protease ATP-binding subunit ClpA
LDITVEEVRAQVASIVGPGDEVPTGEIPFTPRAKKVLELSLREGLALGHDYIGTEHILLGLARVDDGVAARILLDFDADAEKIRMELIRLLSGPGPRPGEFDPVTPEAVAETVRSRPRPLRPIARRAAQREEASWWLRPLLVGWVLFGLAFGVGLLLGWLIWA